MVNAHVQPRLKAIVISKSHNGPPVSMALPSLHTHTLARCMHITQQGKWIVCTYTYMLNRFSRCFLTSSSVQSNFVPLLRVKTTLMFCTMTDTDLENNC